MGITVRDLSLIRYVEKGFLLNSEIASRLVYWTNNERSSLNVAQKRLKEIYRLKQIKRSREYINQSYVYYLSNKAPTKIEHRLKIADFVSQMAMNGFEILLEETELEFSKLESDYHVRPDLLVTFRYGEKTYQALVEVDLTKKFSNGEKYKRVMEDKKRGDLKGILDYPLAVVSVCDSKPDFPCIWIKTDFSNFSNFTYSFIKK